MLTTDHLTRAINDSGTVEAAPVGRSVVRSAYNGRHTSRSARIRNICLSGEQFVRRYGCNGLREVTCSASASFMR